MTRWSWKEPRQRAQRRGTSLSARRMNQCFLHTYLHRSEQFVWWDVTLPNQQSTPALTSDETTTHHIARAKKHPPVLRMWAGLVMHSRLFEGNVHVAVMLFVLIEYTLMEEDEVIIADSPAPGTVPTVTPKMSVFPSMIFVGGDTSISRGYEDNHDQPFCNKHAKSRHL